MNSNVDDFEGGKQNYWFIYGLLEVFVLEVCKMGKGLEVGEHSFHR